MSVKSLQYPVILTDAARGLAQQMVWWGNDVNHPGGNALVRFGMARAPSAGLTGTSCYQAPWEEGVIELHGAVASWTAPHGAMGCVFSRDLGRVDLWTAARPPIPGRQRGESGRAEERWQALQPLLRWLISYETWISQTLGEPWRTVCWRAFKKLPKSKPWLPPHIALSWWQLAIVGTPPRPKTLLECQPLTH